MDENLEEVIKEYALAKLWNDLLLGPCCETANNEVLVDLDNYVSRMNNLVLSNCHTTPSSTDGQPQQQVDELINRLVKNNTELEKCAKAEKEAFLQLTKTKTLDASEEEIIVLDSSVEKKTEKSASAAAKLEKPLVKQPSVDVTFAAAVSKDNDITVCSDHSINEAAVIRMVDSLKKSIEENNIAEIKSLQNEQLLLSKDIDFVRQVCVNLIDIENFDGKLRTLEQIKYISLKEDSLLSFLLNLNHSQVSYNALQIYFRYILGEYFLIKFRDAHSSELFSREIMAAFGRLLKEFPNQFISSCLSVWLIELASDQSNKIMPILANYILKVIKDDFGEIEANIMLTSLTTSGSSSQQPQQPTCWPESLYSIITSLCEKIACVNYETLFSLLSKMQADSTHLAKSNAFSKCLQLLLNKTKGIVLKEQSSSNVNEAATVAEQQPRSISENIRSKFDAIISNNQTFMKKSLQVSLKSLQF